ncbi:hypothetical protein MTO96_015677 [Rhipicephalus appendiculatus]
MSPSHAAERWRRRQSSGWASARASRSRHGRRNEGKPSHARARGSDRHRAERNGREGGTAAPGGNGCAPNVRRSSAPHDARASPDARRAAQAAAAAFQASAADDRPTRLESCVGRRIRQPCSFARHGHRMQKRRCMPAVCDRLEPVYHTREHSPLVSLGFRADVKVLITKQRSKCARHIDSVG